MGWHDELTEEDLTLINEQLRKYKERKFYRKAIHYCMDQTSKMVIIPIWDLLGLPGECRFNVPGSDPMNSKKPQKEKEKQYL